MGYQTRFHSVLKQHYPEQATELRAAVEQAFDRLRPEVGFSKTSKNPIDRRMEIAAYFLACMQVLDERGIAFEQIRQVVVEVALELVRPRNRLQAWAKRLPAKLIGTWFGHWLVGWLGKKFRVLAHPDGFRAVVLTSKAETLGFGYGFDILECGICKLYQKHDALRFAPLLCEVDFITSGLAGLRLIRSGTIANGAKCCDFRFEKAT